MKHVIDSRPVMDFLEDVFESEELSINIVIFNMADKRFDRSIGSPKFIPSTTRPPARKGVVKPVPRPGKNRWGKQDNHNG